MDAGGSSLSAAPSSTRWLKTGLGQPSSTLTALCLQNLLRLRAVILAGQIAAVAAANYVLDVPPPLTPVASVIVGLALVTVLTWRHLQPGALVTDRAILGQLVIDVAGLATLLFYTGGATNPFATLLLVPVIMAAAVLRASYTWIVAAQAAVCYTVLMFVHVHPMHVEIHPPEWQEMGHELSIHLWGMWLGFLLSAAVVGYFVARMGAMLRAHDRELALARERALEAHQLATLGTLAAGTAHELGTPLATIAVLAKEIEREHRDNPALAAQVSVLRQQTGRCKEILTNMAARAGQLRADAGHPQNVDRFMEGIFDAWRELYPGRAFEVHYHGARPGPEILADRTLQQAISNVLNNAVEAAQRRVTVEAAWDDERLTVSICDDGPGFPEELRGHIGEPFVTTKTAGKGLGLGLYLARASLAHFGGDLELRERAGLGVEARITVPLAGLRAKRAIRAA